MGERPTGQMREGDALLIHVAPIDSLPSLNVVADAAHPYPATRIAFQPSSLDEGTSSSSTNQPATRYSSTSKSAKRASWGASYGLQGGEEEYGEGEVRYPDRELLATTADCLRVWECMRDDEDAAVNSYVGDRGQKRAHYGLREKSVLAHVSVPFLSVDASRASS